MDQRLPYEKLRLLARLPEEEIPAWVARAHGLTCVELKSRLEGEAERRTKAQRRVSVPVPLRVASVLAAAVHVVRQCAGRCSMGEPARAGEPTQLRATADRERHLARSKSLKRRTAAAGRALRSGVAAYPIRERSVLRRLTRSRGFDHELCAFHHLRCIHGGWLRVLGEAPDRLRWFLNGVPWNGPVSALADV